MRVVSELNAKVSATANIISSVPCQLQEVGYATLETRDAIGDLTRSISEEFAHIPAGLNKMFEGTLRRVIQDFHTDSLGSFELPPDYSSIHDLIRSQELLPSYKDPDRKILKQKQGRIGIQTWFGVIFIHSTLVKVQDTVK